MPRLPPAATTPVARAGSYPRFFISGSATEDMVAAVALVEPQMAENAAHAPMVAIASPPRRCPRNLCAALKRRPLIPE